MTRTSNPWALPEEDEAEDFGTASSSDERDCLGRGGWIAYEVLFTCIGYRVRLI